MKEAFTYFKIDIHNSIQNKTFDDVMAFTLLHFVELTLKIQRLDFLMFHLSNFRTFYPIPKKIAENSPSNNSVQAILPWRTSNTW